MRRQRTASALGMLALAWSVAVPLAGAVTATPSVVILRKTGGGSNARLVPVLARLLAERPGESRPRVIELTGDAPADTARIAREARAATILYAIGPDATEAAAEVRGAAVVSLGVPNPARLKTAGTYVSIYPRLARVFEFLKTRLAVKRAALVFTPTKNREVALAFLSAAEEQGVTLTPVPVTSSGDLTRELPRALANVEVLLLAVDPVLFDRESLAFIVAQATAARKPTVGFLEELPRLGVTLALVAPPQATAQAAVDAAGAPILVGKRRVDVEGATVIASRKAADALGLDPEVIGAARIE